MAKRRGAVKARSGSGRTADGRFGSISAAGRTASADAKVRSRRRRLKPYDPEELGGRAVDGQLLTTSTPTVATFLEDWFPTNSDTWRPSTRRGYRGAIDGFLVPAFGPLRLEQLTPQACSAG